MHVNKSSEANWQIANYCKQWIYVSAYTIVLYDRFSIVIIMK